MDVYGSTADGLRPAKNLASGRMPWRYLRSSVASHHPVSLASMLASQQADEACGMSTSQSR